MKNEKQKRQSRFRYFHVVLNVPTNEVFDPATKTSEETIQYLEEKGFVKQKALEALLRDFKVVSRDTHTGLTNFVGQLEVGTERGRIHWQLFLETRKQTVVKEIIEYFSKSIFGTKNNFSVQVFHAYNDEVVLSEEYATKPGGLVLPDSDWFPGIIKKIYIDYETTLKEDPVLYDILIKNPRSYQKYLSSIISSPPNDRIIHWVMDFAGNTGKSRFASAMETAGKAITVYMDQPRPFAKLIIEESQEYENKYGKCPDTIIIDLSRQVPQEWLDGFYGVLEMVKNGKLVSTFGIRSVYRWKKPPHVIVFANMPPSINALSRDRLILLEILPKEYNYVIRRCFCKGDVLLFDGKILTYHYTTKHIHKDQMKEEMKASILIFSDLELEHQRVYDNTHYEDETGKLRTASSYVGISEEVTCLASKAPNGILPLILGKVEIRRQV